MYCENCGNKILDNALYCNICGERITAAPQKSANGFFVAGDIGTTGNAEGKKSAPTSYSSKNTYVPNPAGYPTATDWFNQPAKDSKFKTLFNKLPKKLLIAAGVAMLVIVTVIIAGTIATNNYMTQVKIWERTANEETHDIEEIIVDELNGFMGNDAKKIFRILRNSDFYTDIIDEYNEVYDDMYDMARREYGEDFKVKLHVNDKSKLTRSELKECKEEIEYYISCFADIADRAEEYSAADWSDFAENYGLTRSEAKKLVEACAKLAEKYEKIKVTNGYDLDVTVAFTGEYLDEPEEESEEQIVVKVNGRWITPETVRALYMYLESFD